MSVRLAALALLLVHGHWSYVRTAYLVLYNYYKNVAFVLPLFFFCMAHSGFDTQVTIDDWNLIFYSMLFTSVPCVVLGFTEQDLPAHLLLEFPGAYASGPADGAYNLRLFAAWIADALDLPMVYVRKKPKGFGRMAQIEGDLAEGARVLLVEDLATDGGSKIHFVKALRAAGAAVTHTFVVFHYGVFPESIGGLREIGVDLLALATWRDVIAEARRGGDFPETDLAKVEEFLADPVGWQDARQ